MRSKIMSSTYHLNIDLELFLGATGELSPLIEGNHHYYGELTLHKSLAYFQSDSASFS